MNPYELLGVEQSATPDQIHRAYRRAAVKVHPDQSGESEKFLALVKARDILLNPITRDKYDHTGQLPDDGPMQPAVMMIRELAVQCAAKFSQINLLVAIREALKMKRKEFITASLDYKRQIDRVERTWEPGEIKTHIIQEFVERKSLLDAHALTAERALEMLKRATCNEVNAATLSWGAGGFGGNWFTE